jgi:Asp-tRNA(Asn)/Glu-tRNA(Gln) amidotransferase C subunit
MCEQNGELMSIKTISLTKDQVENFSEIQKFVKQLSELNIKNVQKYIQC